jgi:hypothetical protein
MSFFRGREWLANILFLVYAQNNNEIPLFIDLFSKGD